MQSHQIKPTIKSKKKKRVARGGKRGTYSGKGMKGQKSRAGRKLEPPIRGLIKRYHKLRGYKKSSIKEKTIIVSLDLLSKNFKDGDIVSLRTLTDKKIINKDSDKKVSVKILNKGTINKKLIIRNCFVSQSALAEIKKAGGETKDIC
jgi:large subunit ribosomal protein L15